VLSFVLASLALIVIPGPDQALITRNALVGGRRAGLATMVGGVSGVAVHATAAAVGLSALIAASAEAYTTLKLLGVAYLIYLGVQTLRTAGRRRAAGASGEGTSSVGTAVRQGALSNVLNPKVAIFFLTFLPQFLPPNPSPLSALMFAATFAAVYLAWFSCYVALVDRFGRWLRRPPVQLWIERTTGALLVAFGVRLALDRR